MLDIEEGKKTVRLARAVIEDYLQNISKSNHEYSSEFLENKGAFVTIHTFPENRLRGCIGIPTPVMSLRNAIIEAARSVTRDPRFPSLKKEELKKIVIEVTALTKPERIIVENHNEYLSKIEVGRDGLIVEKSFNKGLLLPQVPLEQGWGVKEFLSNACIKAGLIPNAWKDENIKIYKFGGQIFSEIEPKGEIREKSLDGYYR